MTTHIGITSSFLLALKNLAIAIVMRTIPVDITRFRAKSALINHSTDTHYRDVAAAVSIANCKEWLCPVINGKFLRNRCKEILWSVIK